MNQQTTRKQSLPPIPTPESVSELFQTCKFTFRTLKEADALAAFISTWFPNPDRAHPGLLSLAINAIEHGNLGFGFDKKAELLASGTWRSEIERLLATDEHKGKHAELTVSRKRNGIYAVIADQGDGFDWKRYLKVDPARASDNHGRGIALAFSASFDKLAYNGAGNQVIAYAGFTENLSW